MKVPHENQFSVVTLAIAYGLGISSLYLIGYWSTFNINIFQYASLTDVTKIAIYPMTLVVLMTLTASFVFGFVSGKILEKNPEKTFIVLNNKFAKSSGLLAVLVSFVFIMLVRTGDAYLWAGLLISYTIHVNFSYHNFLKSFLPIEVVRNVVIFILMFFVLTSFGRGRQKGESVLEGKNIKVVNTTIFKGKGTTEFKSKSLLEKVNTLKYLGTVGGYFFFISMDNVDVIIAKYDDLHFLLFKK